MATYTDPAAPLGAPTDQLLPMVADGPQAYAALVQAAKDYLAKTDSADKISFTDFLNLNTGVTIDTQELFGLQDDAYQYVEQDPAKYLGTSSPSTSLLAALDAVKEFLDSIDTMRQNFYAFVQAQDSWIQVEVDNILSLNILPTIAQTIVDNQSLDNPPPYLEPPPPQTPSDIGAQVGIEAGSQALEAIASIGLGLFFPEASPAVSALVTGLVNIGATSAATYGTEVLSNTTAQMPKLVIPPNKDNEADLYHAANLYQTQLFNGLTAQDNLANDTGFLYPVFSNLGLLRALANVSPLVLDQQNNDGNPGTSNPTVAAVTNSAWEALLPDYFHWVPIDPTTESQSQNFDNFYPGATPASAGDAATQLEDMQSGNPYQYAGLLGAAVSNPRVRGPIRSNHG